MLELYNYGCYIVKWLDKITGEIISKREGSLKPEGDRLIFFFFFFFTRVIDFLVFFLTDAKKTFNQHAVKIS